MQMSDPLTALMHAVQVMNLLKTLITKTLREREETATTEGYSPMSSCSSDHHHHADEDLYSQHEMDTSSERGQVSDDDENAQYSHSSQDGDHDDEEQEEEDDDDDDVIQALSEIEKCFLRQLDDNKAIMTSFPDDLYKENYADHYESCSVHNKTEESGISVTESNVGNSSLTTSDGEEGVDSGKSLISLENRVDTESSSIVTFT